MRNDSLPRPEAADRSLTWRIARACVLLAAVLIANPVEAQQDGRFEVLSIPPADAGSCLPPLTSSPGTTIRQGNRLVIKSLEPGSSREISTMSHGQGSIVLYNDRTSITRQTVRNEGTSISAILHPTGEITGFRMDIAMTIPDSILRMKDLVAIQRVMDAASSAMNRRALDSAEQRRVRSMLEFIRKRCP